jgi:hypothetical protein
MNLARDLQDCRGSAESDGVFLSERRLGTEVSETSEHDIDPECHLVAIEIEASAAGKDRTSRMEINRLIPKVAEPVFSSDAHDIVKHILNSTAGVPAS